MIATEENYKGFQPGDHVMWFERKTVHRGRVVLLSHYGRDKAPSAWVRLGSHGLDRTWKWVALEKLSKVTDEPD